MFINHLFNFLNRFFSFPARAWYLEKILSPYLLDSKKILDVGTGDGKIAHNLSNRLGVKITGVDTLVQERPKIPVIKYDGKKLPFKDNSFDCVTFIDVLHHCTNQEELISEARRVTRKFILIKDHYWENKFDQTLLKYYDYSGNKPYGINLPYNYLKLDSWKSLFQKSNLKVLERKIFTNLALGLFGKQVIFKLGK